jgi:hypothetical protein
MSGVMRPTPYSDVNLPAMSDRFASLAINGAITSTVQRSTSVMAQDGNQMTTVWGQAAGDQRDLVGDLIRVPMRPAMRKTVQDAMCGGGVGLRARLNLAVEAT